jgi:hypothetical protein
MQKEKPHFQVIPNWAWVQTGMNLKTLLHWIKMPLVFGGLPALITSASAGAATSAIASVSTSINRIARTIRCGMAAAAPAEQGPAVVAGIAGAVRSGAIARR